MLFLAHAGIGEKLVSPWSRRLPATMVAWVVLGTLLPDFVDKPHYYALSWATGMRGEALGLICGTRTIGHTALFTLAIALGGWFTRSRAALALALGCASHLVLDNVGDAILTRLYPDAPAIDSALTALTWPFWRQQFSPAPFHDVFEHLRGWLNPLALVTEPIGGAILAWDYWKYRHESAIVQSLRSLRGRRERLLRAWRRG
jgi:hypothetical protein